MLLVEKLLHFANIFDRKEDGVTSQNQNRNYFKIEDAASNLKLVSIPKCSSSSLILLFCDVSYVTKRLGLRKPELLATLRTFQDLSPTRKIAISEKNNSTNARVNNLIGSKASTIWGHRRSYDAEGPREGCVILKLVYEQLDQNGKKLELADVKSVFFRVGKNMADFVKLIRCCRSSDASYGWCLAISFPSDSIQTSLWRGLRIQDRTILFISRCSHTMLPTCLPNSRWSKLTPLGKPGSC